MRDLPLGFVLDDYVSIYPGSRGNSRDASRAPCSTTGATAARSGGMIGKWLFKIADLDIDLPSAGRAAARGAAQTSRVEVCILIHAFYPELLPELVALRAEFPRCLVRHLHQSRRHRLDAGDAGAGARDLSRRLRDAVERRRARRRRLHAAAGAHRHRRATIVFAFMHSKKSPHIAAGEGRILAAHAAQRDRRQPGDRRAIACACSATIRISA